MNYSKNVLFHLVTFILLITFSCCKKTESGCNNISVGIADSCLCEPEITAYEYLPSITDSNYLKSIIAGDWSLKCLRFTSKYGDVHYQDWEKQSFKLNVSFTDTSYSYFQNDSLLFTYPYFMTGEVSLYSSGNSFYFGVLGASLVTYKDSLIGINTVYPFTGSYYLTFKRK